MQSKSKKGALWLCFCVFKHVNNVIHRKTVSVEFENNYRTKNAGLKII